MGNAKPFNVHDRSSGVYSICILAVAVQQGSHHHGKPGKSWKINMFIKKYKKVNKVLLVKKIVI